MLCETLSARVSRGEIDVASLEDAVIDYIEQIQRESVNVEVSLQKSLCLTHAAYQALVQSDWRLLYNVLRTIKTDRDSICTTVSRMIADEKLEYYNWKLNQGELTQLLINKVKTQQSLASILLTIWETSLKNERGINLELVYFLSSPSDLDKILIHLYINSRYVDELSRDVYLYFKQILQ